MPVVDHVVALRRNEGPARQTDKYRDGQVDQN